ncbi:MAG: thiamine phosphate synthase [Fibromonadaceae bacterium]|jgi:thiamine-phosphate pyrophosphorylase|nr:thiamine phosphate synthase [Fibromonadaceae bacterium]
MFQLALISSPENFAGEHEILEQMFERGLQMLYARKPQMPELLLERWLLAFDLKWQSKILPWLGSAHSFEDLEKISDNAEICFLSPVFDSISKFGYKAKYSKDELKQGITAWRDFQKKQNRSQKLFALGGVEADNIAELKELGFDGAAILGAIWHDPDPVGAWELLKNNALHRLYPIPHTPYPSD